MGIRVVKIPRKLLRQFDDDLMYLIDDDWFPIGVLATRMIAKVAPELHQTLVEAGLDLLIVPGIKEFGE